MGLKANFEETPTLLAPPSYLESTSHNHSDPSAAGSLQHINIAPRYTAWKLILSSFLNSIQTIAVDDLDREEAQASALAQVLCHIRLVSRLLYSVSMSLLRPMYFPEYLKAIPSTVYSTNLTLHTLDHPCRETRVLDHYISYRIHRRRLASQSSLLLNNDDMESDHRQVLQDLFKWLQPQTYMEDEIGKALETSIRPSNGVRFRDLLVRFRFTRAAITLPFLIDKTLGRSSDASRPSVVRKEVVTVDRAANEPVFVTAHNLLHLLNRLVLVRKTHGETVWYEVGTQTG